ncbi:hypothetical protein [Ureibacillus chungkukjangi]|uniref:DUF2157 domain-containing protein n=1 Tax=Ureibacillus chungkukjangi TaxID=1202712 RepID=A0A318THT0_9BACL|nr:hypothetical protein [Ureibacillus chungkukjangi]MCM3387960.1 hypothetical protein [Ureibacillus chungkukjangi]PYF04286.1 hypothetical protein BJ095_12436 [Ureibacillus chungkukjangi]
MANSKKTIIMNEILFWKQNKLLPDHYCDFLMTLYSEGNEIELEEEVGHKNSVIAREKRKKILLFSIISIISICLLVALFMVSELVWLIGLAVGIVAILFMVLAYRFAKKNEILVPILHIGSALMLFGLSVKISVEYFPTNQFVLYGLLIINCFMWLFTGFKFKLMYFTVSGALGIIVLIGYQIMNF